MLRNDKLIRRHYLPRDALLDPSDATAGCPLPPHYLSKDRQTTGADNLNKYDRWKQQGSETTQHTWTRQTSFKILPAYRLLAYEAFYNISHQSYIEPTAEQAYQADETGHTSPSPQSIKACKDQLKE